MSTSTYFKADKAPSEARQYSPCDEATRLAVRTAVVCAVLAIALPIITCLIVRENDRVFDAWWYHSGGGFGLSVLLAVATVVMGTIAGKNKQGKTKAAAKLALNTCIYSVIAIMAISLVRITLLVYGAEADAWLYRYGCAAGITILLCVIIIIAGTIVAYDVIATRKDRASPGGDIEPGAPDADNG